MTFRALLAVVLGTAVWHSLSPLARDITRFAAELASVAPSSWQYEGAKPMTSAAKEPGTRRCPAKVGVAAIRQTTLAGLAVILVSTGPVVAMAAPGSPEAGKNRPPGPNDRAGARPPVPC